VYAAASKKKEGDDPSEDPLTADQKNVFLLRQIESLKHQLVMEAHRASEAQTAVHELRDKLLAMQTLIENERREKLSIATDMTKLYKSLKEEKAEQIRVLLGQIDTLNVTIEAERHTITQLRSKHALDIAEKEAALRIKNDEMNKMAEQFRAMLQVTLNKLSERLPISNEWQAHAPLSDPIGGGGGGGSGSAVKPFAASAASASAVAAAAAAPAPIVSLASGSAAASSSGGAGESTASAASAASASASFPYLNKDKPASAPRVAATEHYLVHPPKVTALTKFSLGDGLVPSPTTLASNK